MQKNVGDSDEVLHDCSGFGVVFREQVEAKALDERRIYTFYSGWVGGLKKISLGELRESNPRKLITIAVRRMLPKNKMGRVMLKRLKVYRDGAHRHTAQQPRELVVDMPSWTPERSETGE